MYRTDKQFMKNPATASSRIFIGNLGEGLIQQDLEDRFKVYGKILGLILQRGFGFVQYEKDFEAQAAIEKENGSMFNGRKINVKQAYDKRPPQKQSQQQQQFRPQQPHQQQYPQQQQQERAPSPHKEPPQEPTPPPQRDDLPKAKPPGPPSDMPPENNLNKPEELPPEDNRPPSSYGGPRDHDEDSQSFDRRSEPYDSYNGPSGPPEKRRRGKRNYNSDFGPPIDNYRDAPPPKYYGRDDPYPPPPFVPPAALDVPLPPERNDCEIIVVAKPLTEYAEFIEKKLKSIGLIVDLLFPNEDVPIGRVLANISSRGCLYAILVMPLNEENRSLTLNILHGIPQEHRNMPIEDALKLISRNFEAYMRGEKTFPPAGVNGTNISLEERHPEQMQIILNLLAENRQLATAQYDRILKYLAEKRELQHKYEIAEGVEGATESEVDNKAAELQSRIMNILNKSGGNSDSPKPTGPPTESSGGAAPTPLLNDPSVQKALDSLLSGEMFKGISTGL